MAAPRVDLAAHITATEHRMIGRALRKQLGNLQFTQWTQETEILHFVAEILGHIVPEVTFKFDGFAVLVVDVGARHRRLVGAVLVRQGDIF